MSDLHDLPDGWEWKKLGSLSTTTSGGTPKRNEKSYWNGNIGWLKSGELNDGYIDKVEELITEEGLKKSSAKLFPKGTLLIAMYGATVGKLGILDIETTTNQAICGILNDKKMFITKYMFYYLKSIKEKMLIDSFGGAQPNLSQTYMKDLDIPLPPLSEQQRIVSKLDLLFKKIDKSIELHQKNMDEANAFMGSILNEVFIELEEKYGLVFLSKTVDNPKKDIVDGPFGSNLKATEYIDSGVPIIRLQNIQRFKFIDKDIKFVSKEKAEGLKRHTFISGDIVITKLGDPLGKSCVVPDFLEYGIIVADVIRLRPNNKKALTNFIISVINSQICINQFSDNSKGATRQRVKLTMVRDLKIPLPPLSIQQKVVDYLDSVSEKMEKVKTIQKEKMDSLKALKASILDKAFRGEL